MLAGIRGRLTFANVISVIALFIALGGVAWAAATIDSRDVVNNSLKSIDLKDSKAVKGADVVPESLSGAAIDEASLGQVPSAADADTLDGTDSSGFVAPGSEGWQPLGLYTNPGFCHWENYGNGFNPAAMFRDPAGVVHLRGLIKAVDGTTDACGVSPNSDPLLLTGFLPQGYRPANRELFTISSNDKPARLDVSTSGQPQIAAPSYPTWADAKAWVSLDGVSYRCAPSGQSGCP